MTQSPPKASSSSRPPAPAALDGGRLMTALAAGGSVLLLSATAVLLWPRTYGTEATFVLDGGARVENPVALAGRIEAVLLERDQLAGVAMELPPELRSPDPIGRLRAGIRVQSRGALGYAVEFRGSDPQSVQRIANRLADKAVAAVPKLASSPDDAASLKELAARSRAVSEFLTAHPEIAVEPPSGKPATNPSQDSGLDLLRTEKRQIEQKLAAAPVDNPYAEPDDDPAQLNRRLAELKNVIAKREAALKQPRPAAKAAASPELVARWRQLLADLAAAQAKASTASAPVVTAHVTARAPLPTSPLTPNRLVLSIVAALLSLAAAMVAYILPRKLSARAPQRPRSNPPPPQAGRSDPPPAAVRPPSDPPRPRSDPPPPAPLPRSDPPPPALGSTAPLRAPSTAPLAGAAGPTPRSDPPPARPPSEPPGPMAPQRTVVLTSAAPLPTAEPPKRSNTAPGGLEAPSPEAIAAAALASPPAHAPSSPPPAAPLFGSRPPPGAGSYSVSSSHPPPYEGGPGNTRTSIERLKPLQSAHPPAPPPPTDHAPSPPPAAAPASDQVIMSRPPALDPEAERWAARFDSSPPPAEEEQPQRKRAARWKTQVMGSMVPLEVSSMREERPPPSEVPVATGHAAAPAPAAPDRRIAIATPMPPPNAELIEHDVPAGWRPNVNANDAKVLPLRDAVLAQGLGRPLRIAVTGSPGTDKAQLASALALSLSFAGARVLLIEADFDRPQVHQALAVDAPSGAGFSQQIVARRSARDQRPWVAVRCGPNLHALVEGRLRSPGLLGSDDFERAVNELAGGHHVIVMHAPALDGASDLRTIDALSQAAVIARANEPIRIQFGQNPLRTVL